jgi:hypothetical protein
MKKTVLIIGEHYQCDVTVGFDSINYKDLTISGFRLVSIEVLVIYNAELAEWLSVDTQEIGKESTIWNKIESLAKEKIKSQFVSIDL